MAEVIATVRRAAQQVARGTDPGTWNPVYRALVDTSGIVPAGEPAAPVLEEDDLDLVRRQLTARALLVVAVTDGERTRRLRIDLDPAGAGVERSDDEGPSRFSRLDMQEVPGLITALLEEAGPDPAPARLEIGHRGQALRLTPEQNRLARSALDRGVSAEAAFADLPGLEDALRDALTATGPRISLSLSLHDPHGEVAEQPVTWSRLWVQGRLGLYRLDQPSSPALEVHPVGGGDVLGSVLPVLDQGLRFSAACTTAGGAR